MYQCDTCGKRDNSNSIDIGFDLENLNLTCSCGGKWKKINKEAIQ